MDPKAVELLILDIDGVLTNGRLLFSSDGEQTKAFHVQDGCAIRGWQRADGRVALLSGRDCGAMRRRAEELGIDIVHAGVRDKLAGYQAILETVGCSDTAVAYVGDDLPDIAPMLRAGFPIAVANAVPAVKKAAMYVTRKRGGDGAVAEVVELLLRKKKRWSPGKEANA